MTADEVTAIASAAMFLIIKVAAPLLLVSLAVGLIVSIFQTVTPCCAVCQWKKCGNLTARTAWQLYIPRMWNS